MIRVTRLSKSGVPLATRSWSPNPLNAEGLFASFHHGTSLSSGSNSPRFLANSSLYSSSPSGATAAMMTHSSKESVLSAAFAEFPYEPFHFESNDFFEHRVAREQLTLRAAEKLWRNPVWISEATVRELKLSPMPMEVPIPLWMPLCSMSCIPLRAFPHNIQQLTLKKFRLHRQLQQQGGHVVLAPSFAQYSWSDAAAKANAAMSRLPSVAESSDSGLAAHQYYSALSNQSSKLLAWHVVPPIHTSLFDASWRVFQNHIWDQKRRGTAALTSATPFGGSSRKRNEERLAREQLDCVWISHDARKVVAINTSEGDLNLPRSNHATTTKLSNAGRTFAGIVETPCHVGLYFNAAQLYSTQVLLEKTTEALERLLLRRQKRSEGTLGSSSSSSEVTAMFWPPIERTYDIGAETLMTELSEVAAHSETDSDVPSANHSAVPLSAPLDSDPSPVEMTGLAAAAAAATATGVARSPTATTAASLEISASANSNNNCDPNRSTEMDDVHPQAEDGLDGLFLFGEHDDDNVEANMLEFSRDSKTASPPSFGVVECDEGLVDTAVDASDFLSHAGRTCSADEDGSFTDTTMDDVLLFGEAAAPPPSLSSSSSELDEPLDAAIGPDEWLSTPDYQFENEDPFSAAAVTMDAATIRDKSAVRGEGNEKAKRAPLFSRSSIPPSAVLKQTVPKVSCGFFPQDAV